MTKTTPAVARARRAGAFIDKHSFHSYLAKSTKSIKDDGVLNFVLLVSFVAEF
jgi:hypothetical protein